MPEHLLRTKLATPRLRASDVARPRLLARLDEALPQAGAWQRALTVISAPAGYGKTTLLCQWLGGCGHPAAWLSLDEADNDPARFLSYLVAALQKIEPDLGIGVLDTLGPSGVASAGAPPVDRVLTHLLNEIASIRDPFVLVLDDYHLIEAARVRQVVTFLLDHQPLQMHLVVATRVDPPLPVARLRAQAQLAEVHAADLCFTVGEARAFLNDAMGLSLTAEQVAALERRTEGWIAGLQLAAVALKTSLPRQEPLDVQSQDGVSHFIEAFTGSHRYILDYLTEEVLNRQDPEIHSFLLRTAILGRLTAPLCETLSGRADCQEVLEALEAANLFIIALDEERRWYRYHHLFADLLRQRLQRERGDLVPELHRRASAWYEKHEWLPEAIKHALFAQDYERARRLIEENGWTMLVRGEMSTLLRWLEALPPASLDAAPALGILQAWALAFTGHWDRVEKALVTIDAAAVPGQVVAVRAYVAAVNAEVERTYELAEEAFVQLPEGEHFLRALANFCVAITCFSSGQPPSASQALAEVIRLSRAAAQPHLEMTATAHLGHVQEMQGLLHQALATHRNALRLAPGSIDRPVPFHGIACVGIAEVLYEWNDLDGALQQATEGIRLTKMGGFVSYMLAGHARVIQVKVARGEMAEAWEKLDEAQRLAEKHGYRYMQGVFAELRARLWIAQGHLAEAWRWARMHRLRPGDALNLAREVEQMAVARILIARAAARGGNVAEALDLLARLLSAAQEAERTGSAIKILALQAVASEVKGDREQALSLLARALSLAEPQGYVRTFLDEGQPMARLLRQALTDGIATGYAASLLAAFDEGSDAPPAEAEALVEPLSERELQVLQLIVAGLSNREIARELVIAISTVKTHINNIYGKMGVSNRVEAVTCARERHLVQ